MCRQCGEVYFEKQFIEFNPLQHSNELGKIIIGCEYHSEYTAWLPASKLGQCGCNKYTIKPLYNEIAWDQL